MRTTVFLWICLLADWILPERVSGVASCPPGCYCVERKSDLVPDGVGIRINCHPLLSGPLNFSLLPASTIQLDLAKYGLKSLASNAFASSPYLQKLDLQNNEISKIEDGAFRNLLHLELVDLSRNSLKSIPKEMFSGLKRLERLKLNDNRLQTVENGSFDELTSLTKLELSDNSFVCNCSLIWFVDWLANKPAILTNPSRTKCSLPIDLADVPLRKANKEEFRCGDFAKDVSKPIGMFQLEPNEHQVVFEGDPLKLKCRLQISSSQKVTWLVKGKPIDASDADNVFTTSTLLPGDTVESTVAIVKVRAAFSGDWTCVVSPVDETPTISTIATKPSSIPFQKSVNILVMTPETKLCSPFVTHTSRGTFRWGVAVGGHTVQQACPSTRQQQRGFGFAYFLCKQTGEWAPNVNATQCAYASVTTETLHKFASMNTSFDTTTLLESAKHFLNFTSNPEIFQDPLDVVYFSKAVANYLPYLRRNTDVGHYMLDMISKTLAIEPDLMGRAQKRGLASKQLVDIVENITNVVPSFQHHDQQLAVEGHPLKPLQFEGLACTWYDSAAATSANEFQRLGSKRVFHCSPGNKTLPSAGKKIIANVVTPSNLLQALTSQTVMLLQPVGLQLTFAALANSSLFPTTSTTTDFEAVRSPVIGAFVSGAPVFNLTEPVYVVLSTSENLNDLDLGSVQPVWWNPASNGGFGDWSPEFCKLINAKSNLVWFSCSRLGYYGYRFSKDALGQKSGSVFRLLHPVAYAGAAICISMLLLSIMVYITCHTSLRMSRKLKHALPNVWTSMALLCFLYVAGINQTQHQVICRSIGMTIHFLTLTTLLWLVVCSHVVYQKVTKQRRQTIHRATVGQDTVRNKLKRPVTRFYLFGYGVALIVVIITASINVDYYVTQRHCFMKLPPFLGSVIIIAAVLLSLFIGFALSSYCVVSTAPSHVTEQIEIDVLGGGRNGGSLLSVTTLQMPDEEHSVKSVLRSLTLLLIFYVVCWSMAALAVSTKSTFEQVFLLEDLFAIFFGLASCLTSFFVFVTFCVLRRDVRRCWRRPICLSTSRHRAYNQHDNEDDDRLLETSNLVNAYPVNPVLMGQSASGGPSSFNFPSNTINDNLPNPHGFNFGIGGQMQMQGQQFDSQQMSMHRGGSGGGAGSMQRVTRGTVIAQKEVTPVRKDSDEVSSDHLSLNNMNHLRRGYVAPVNSGCVSEADYTMLPVPGNLFLPKMTSHPPHTSSPAGSSLPQFFDLSPLAPPESHPSNVGQMSKRDNLSDSRIENGYTESCTIKVGQPCQLANLTTVDFPSNFKRPAAMATSSTLNPAISSVGSTASGSRKQHYSRQRSKNGGKQTAASPDREDDDKRSVGSSTCYSNGGKSSKRVHKRPKRRKPRNKSVAKYDEDFADNFDENPSSLPASSEDQIFEPLLASEDDVKESNSSQLIHDFNADLLKRETSV